MTPEQEKARLLQRDAEWSAQASAGGDVEAIVSYWTSDAMVLGPDLPVIAGEQALRAYVEQSFKIPGFRISWTSTDVTLSPDNKLAYMVGTNSVTVNGEDGEPVVTNGRVVTIWRKEDDGEWRCAVDIWNSGPTA